MSLWDFTFDPKGTTDAEDTNIPLKAATRGDLFKAAVEDAYINDSLVNDSINKKLYSSQNKKALETSEGVPYDTILKNVDPEAYKEYTASVTSDVRREQIDGKIISTLKQRDPEKYSDVLTPDQIDEIIKVEKLGARRNYLQAHEGSPDDFLTGLIGFAGRAYGQMASPDQAALNIVLGPLGTASSKLPLLYRLLVGGAKNAGVNAAYEGVTQPFIGKELQDAKISYDTGNYIESVASGAGGGFGLGVLSEGAGAIVKPIVKKVFGKKNKADAFEIMSQKAKEAGDQPYAEVLSKMSDAQRVEEANLSKITDMPESDFDASLKETEIALANGESIPDAAADRLAPHLEKVDVEQIKSDDLADIVTNGRKSLQESIELDTVAQVKNALDPDSIKRLDELNAQVKKQGLTPEIKSEIDGIIIKMSPEKLGDTNLKQKLGRLKNAALSDKIAAGKATEVELKVKEKLTGERMITPLDRESESFKKSGLEYSEYLQSDKAMAEFKKEYEDILPELENNEKVSDPTTGKQLSAKQLSERQKFGEALKEAMTFCAG